MQKRISKQASNKIDNFLNSVYYYKYKGEVIIINEIKPLFSSCSEWIWTAQAPECNCYVQFQTNFQVFDLNLAARLHISVQGQYAAFLNGTYIPSGQYADFTEYKAVQIPDITTYLCEGENRLEIQAWYPGIDTSVSRKEEPGLRFEIWQGEKLLCQSSGFCNARLLSGYVQGVTEQITPQLGMTFQYDREEPEPWGKAVTVAKKANLVLRPVREMEIGNSAAVRIKSQGIFRLADGKNAGEQLQRAGLYFQKELCSDGGKRHLPNYEGLHFKTASGDGIYLLLDLEKTTSGFLALDITTPTETRIDIGFGEHLEDLRVRTELERRSFVVTSHAGPIRNRQVHYFRRLGCRYLQLFLYSREAVIYEAGLLPVIYPVNEELVFGCSDSLHCKIYETAKRTLHLCMHEHYEDCPWREQALYGFDARNQMLAGYYAFGEFTYARENLRLLALSLRSDGLLELCAPAKVPVTIPGFSLAFVTALEEYCRYSGDLSFGEEMLPTAGKILDSFRSHVQQGIAWNYRETGYWNFYEWNELLDGLPIERGVCLPPSGEAALQLFGLLALQRMAALYRYLKLNADELEQECEVLKQGLESFWNEEEGAYASFLREGEKLQYAELIQALALYTGACPEERKSRLQQGLLKEQWMPVTLGCSIYKYEALLMEPDLYGKAVFQQIAERWGKMLFSGSDTFWETDRGADAFEGAGSLCHGWSGIPIYLYGAYILGVQPESPGIWRPKEKTDSGIHAAWGVLQSPEGMIEIGATPGCRLQNWFCLRNSGEKIYL